MDRTITLSPLVSVSSPAPRTVSVAPPRARVPARARWARVGLIATTLAVLVAVFAASLIGPFIMFAAPLILVMGSALGPLHALMRGEL